MLAVVMSNQQKPEIQVKNKAFSLYEAHNSTERARRDCNLVTLVLFYFCFGIILGGG